jgi:predicted RNase H-like HicB family nuclease
MAEQQNQFTAVFEPASEGGWIAWVEELPGAVTQGETIEEARENLTEAVELILEANRELRQASAVEGVIRETITVFR